ncbi:sigma-70 family RNA polymerase sigma factor [Hymenobacter aerilatus]|uniref:Sigma-70 family RNA polymerase sigma factor n=1 Tax=Hymenobacter aerilatus TaxID=2932251 RepID=A0A8T9SV90_9BACT|nr:sigma-70 family RNA polymerase sigma factor [Hymenobacter aerilatus]UOR03696.1 sigma-70 family RNA polymerase sigma factor [Hymenobacter aerilatus]
MISEPTSVEAALVQRLYQRDEAAMLLFYDQYSAMLYGVILRIVKHAHLAEDVLQESMLKIWHAFPSYSPTRGRLSTWALNICRNKAIDELRALRARGAECTTALPDRLPAAQQLVATAFHPEHVGVRELIRDLSPAAQQLLDMLYFQGYTQQEAAEALGEPLGTVKSRARAALGVLARRLRGTEG